MPPETRKSTNHHNTLPGGTALAWMDEVSFIAATRFCRLPLVTVSTERPCVHGSPRISSALCHLGAAMQPSATQGPSYKARDNLSNAVKH
ncbi:hypothetical protein HU760_019010 [Pseudomonas sp. RD9SR1]|uniref:HotDog ACOT-type domain-containing protein n=1 Tax=Pseudomonas oryzicola TaxID=485876 RepID=A0ABS6QEN8_9PSED|nr:hypothetical protein [Pseudomonas oryzicola]